jgi:hypothetical protein
VAFFAVSGMRVQGDALRSGGQRKLGLPDTLPDPTDGDALYAAFRARRRELSGERRLFLAVVMAALEDLRRYPSGTKPHAAAVRWFLSDDECWPLAFRAACTTLELDPEAVRKRVLAGVAVRAA